MKDPLPRYDHPEPADAGVSEWLTVAFFVALGFLAGAACCAAVFSFPLFSRGI